MDSEILDIVTMPLGGPDASWLDKRLQTDRLEYLDRDDVDDLKRKVATSLDRGRTATAVRCVREMCPDRARRGDRYPFSKDP